MKDRRDLELVLTSDIPVLVVETMEERRIVRLFTDIGLNHAWPTYGWSATEGLRRFDLDFDAMQDTSEPEAMLRHIKGAGESGHFLLLDFHPYLDNPVIIRLIKEIAMDYENVARTLIFISHAFDIPPEIKHVSARFDLKLPNKGALKKLIRDEAARWQKIHQAKRLNIDDRAVERLSANLVGVTFEEARRLVRNAIEEDDALTHSDLPKVMKAKYALLNTDEVVAYEYDTVRFSEVAGLKNLKQWLSHRKASLLGENSRLDQPKGIMLLGVQGSGKSMAAKAVAGTFGIPLIRMDFGSLYNKYHGESEKNLRTALNRAEVMSPCVLWMDEIEKGLSQGGASEDGLSQRILGTLLTWMAEHRSRVFIVATANDIEKLPPELMRKGRLDEIFFVDLPDGTTRKEIFSIHLRRRNIAPSGFDLTMLAMISKGFTGAEIEQAIVSASYVALSNDNVLDTVFLQNEIESTRPLSILMAEKINGLRRWAKNRTVSAG